MTIRGKGSVKLKPGESEAQLAQQPQNYHLTEPLHVVVEWEGSLQGKENAFYKAEMLLREMVSPLPRSSVCVFVRDREVPSGKENAFCKAEMLLREMVSLFSVRARSFIQRECVVKAEMKETVSSGARASPALTSTLLKKKNTNSAGATFWVLFSPAVQPS